jgi:phospholipid/cholesterol/gamma-HCH transport system substrate-binding protein
MAINRKINEVQVGILTTFAVVILVIGMMWFKNVDLSGEKIRYQVDFSRVEGLRVGDRVQIRGIRMGEVESLTLLSTAVRVQIKMGEEADLRQDAQIILGEKGIVGEIVLEIDPGQGEPATEGHIFQGRTAGTIAAMTDAAGAALEEMLVLTAKVTELVDEVKEQGKVVETLAQAHETLGKIDQMIESNQVDIEQSLANLVVATEGLAEFVESGKVSDAFESVDSALSGADSLMINLNTASDRLNLVLGKMDSGDGSLAKMLNDPLLYDRADSTMASVKRLVDAMRRNPKRYFKVNVVDF